VNHRVIELGLQGAIGGGSGIVPALRSVSDTLVRMLADLSVALEAPSCVELRDRLEKCRADLAAEQDPQRIKALAAQCADASQALVAHVETQRSQKQRECAVLIDLVRDAMTSIAGDDGQFDGRLGQTMERFEALGRINNLQELQARLASEVKTLKQMASARRKTWEARFATFGQRIAALEDQLITTRQEITTDPVTRIPNRVIFDKTCRAWARSARLQFSLVLVQVEELNQINDEHGHPTGDRVLQSVADALKSVPHSEDDLVARVGGGDFALLVSELSVHQVEARLRAAITKLVFGVETADKTRIKPVLNCGVTDSAAGDTSESLIERAGQALLEARRGGKNRIIIKSKPLVRDLLRQ